MRYIVDDIGEVVAAMRSTPGGSPQYLYGHRLVIANQLIRQDKDGVAKHKKYPLIALRMDIPEDYDKGVYDCSLNLAIMNYTEKTFDPVKRYEQVFKKILYPLYEDFLLKLSESGLFIWVGQYPKHTKVDRPFWGTPTLEKNEKHIFNDPIDAIELINLKLKYKTC